MAPDFPKLVFWTANLDGPLYRVRVAHRRLIAPQEFSFVEGELRLELRATAAKRWAVITARGSAPWSAKLGLRSTLSLIAEEPLK